MSESAEMKLATGEWKPIKVPTLNTRPTIDQWRTLADWAPVEARRWEKELLWCEDCQEWHAPASRGMTVAGEQEMRRDDPLP